MRATRSRQPVFLGLIVVLTLMASACGGGGVDNANDSNDGRSGGAAVSGRLEVFAAASLTDVFDELAADFQAQHPGVEVRLNVAGSSALREQLREGAPADVFASASPEVMGQVEDLGLLVAPSQTFARNQLRIAVPIGNPGGITSIEDFGRSELSLGLCQAGVPCGELARGALTGAGVEESIDTNEPDVRALLTKVAADELDGGIVYVTDVAAALADVEGVDIDGGPQAEYPIAVIEQGSNPTTAEAFVAFVLSAEGQARLDDKGFLAP